MNDLSQSFFSFTLKQLLLTSFFIIFTIPLVITYGGRVSANYAFVFLPILIILFTGKIKVPNNNIILIILFFCITLICSLLYQIDFYKYTERRFISFMLFMTLFTYLFINITDDMVIAFKIAMIVFSVGYSLLKITDYFLLGGLDLGFNAKDAIGSQRFGFIFVLAFWILALYQSKIWYVKILKLVCILIIFFGLMNTFSRTPILALIGSLIIYYFVRFNWKLKLPSLKSLSKYIFLFLFIIFITLNLFSIQYEFYVERVFNFFLDGSFIKEITKVDAKDSLGYRIIIFLDIFNYVAHNPFTGSGFLGCWVIYENLNCSAHSQYSDIFFRTGIFGFFIYLYLLFRIAKYLKSTHTDLFYGFIAILIYGLVHETFKLSHGAFILSFLLGMTYNKKYNICFSDKKHNSTRLN